MDCGQTQDCFRQQTTIRDGWMASLTWWTWVWASSGSWWWTGKPGVLQSMGSQRVGNDRATELNWDLKWSLLFWSFIFRPTAFQKEWAAFMGAWCPLPVFRNCFVEVALSIQMIFWWICGGKSGLPVLFLQYVGQEATVRNGHGTTAWFQIGKGVWQDCLLSPCLFNLYASTSCEALGWMKQKLESRLPGEISITSDTQMTPPLW